jgi:ubiquinone/menaquinone biosynthesis C-methylase UbiE
MAEKNDGKLAGGHKMNKSNLNLPPHLQYWQEDVDLETFKEWCGSFETSWKRAARKAFMRMGYKNILDVGAGVFSEYYGFKDMGYDIDYTATEITEKYVTYGRGHGIKVELCSMDDMPFEDDQFESAFCFDVLNHQLCYKKAIKELLRVTEKEVLIGFFKTFQEDFREDERDPRCHIAETDVGLFQTKEIKTIKNNVGVDILTPSLIHSHFNRAKMKAFLSSLGVTQKWLVHFGEHGQEKIMLSLRKPENWLEAK